VTGDRRSIAVGDDKKGASPMRSPFEWVFRASALVLGAVIALNLAVVFLRPILPWIVGGMLVAFVVWLVVVLVRWRRSRW
jgi:hypothetical protein